MKEFVWKEKLTKFYETVVNPYVTYSINESGDEFEVIATIGFLFYDPYKNLGIYHNLKEAKQSAVEHYEKEIVPYYDAKILKAEQELSFWKDLKFS